MIKEKLVAIDLETSGKYPLGSEICEVSLIKFEGSKEIERYSSLIKPKKTMGEAVIKIHGITNEMVKDAPSIEEVIPKIHDFTNGHSLVGHNIPFDLGFLAWEFEQADLPLWDTPHFCTSLLSINLQPKLTSHRLKYLAQHFEIQNSPNHRAEQDAITCLQVFLKLSSEINNTEELTEAQKDDLKLSNFSINKIKADPKFKAMVEEVSHHRSFNLMYSKGSRKNKWRELKPKGIVLKTKEESFVVGTDVGEVQAKRFFLSKIVDTKALETV